MAEDSAGRRAAQELGRIATRAGITQVALAAAIGVSQSQCSKIVRGARPMTLDQFFAGCAALRVDPAELVRDAQ